MPSHVKTIAGAKDVVLSDGSPATLVMFTDGDFTWCAGAADNGESQLRAGETLIISAEDPPEILD
jgi:hypothetical protein